MKLKDYIDLVKYLQSHWKMEDVPAGIGLITDCYNRGISAKDCLYEAHLLQRFDGMLDRQNYFPGR